MQKSVNKIILFLIMISICNPVKAGNFEQKVIYTIAAFCAGSGFSYLIMRSNNEANRLKQERLLIEAKRKEAVHENKEKAQKIYHEIKNNHNDEFNSIEKNNGQLTKDVVEKALLSTDHSDYVDKVHNNLEKLNATRHELHELQQEEAKKMVSWLKIIEEQTYLYFKQEILKEREKKREERKQQQLFELQKANKQEKLKAKQVKTRQFEEIAQETKKAIATTSNNAEALMKGLIHQANANAAVNVAAFEEIRHWLREEFKTNGLHSLSQKVHNVKDAVERSLRINEETKIKISRDLETLFEMVLQTNERINQMKSDGRPDNEINKALNNLRNTANEILKRVENHTVKLNELKTAITAPSAPVLN